MEKINSRLQQAIFEKVFPGCAIGIISAQGKHDIITAGNFTYDSASPRINVDSVFDVASLTKVIPTSTLALRLLDKKRISLDDKLIKYVPEFCNSCREKVFIKHLLTQTLNYNFRLSSYKDGGADAILKAIFTSEFLCEPGKSFFYSNATSILLGLVVERVFGKRLDVLAKEELFDPLQMSSTSFYAEDFAKDRIVPTEIDLWRDRLIQGEVHDESAWVLRSKMIAGSAGVFSTIPDILKFLSMILGRGRVDKKEAYFSEEIILKMHTNQISHLDLYAGLGWELNQKRYMGNFCTEQTMGKTGFTGCVCVVDIQKKVAFVLLSNYTYPIRKPDTKAIDNVRRDIADIILSM